ncbi:MAG: hypothetical protein ACFB00_11780 [Parvularculaceae bacterium]
MTMAEETTRKDRSADESRPADGARFGRDRAEALAECLARVAEVAVERTLERLENMTADGDVAKLERNARALAGLMRVAGTAVALRDKLKKDAAADEEAFTSADVDADIGREAAALADRFERALRELDEAPVY